MYLLNLSFVYGNQMPFDFFTRTPSMIRKSVSDKFWIDFSEDSSNFSQDFS